MATSAPTSSVPPLSCTLDHCGWLPQASQCFSTSRHTHHLPVQRGRAGRSLSGECSASLRSEVLKLFWLRWKQRFPDSRPYFYFSVTLYQEPISHQCNSSFLLFNAILACCSEARAFAFHFNTHIPFGQLEPRPAPPFRAPFQSLPTQQHFPNLCLPLISQGPPVQHAETHGPVEAEICKWTTSHWILGEINIFFLQLFIMKLHTPVHTCASQMYPCVHTQNMSIKRVSYKTHFGNFTLSAIKIMAWAAEFSLGWYVLKLLVNLNHEEALMLPFVLNDVDLLGVNKHFKEKRAKKSFLFIYFLNFDHHCLTVTPSGICKRRGKAAL